jgi:hypothetical protein
MSGNTGGADWHAAEQGDPTFTNPSYLPFRMSLKSQTFMSASKARTGRARTREIAADRDVPVDHFVNTPSCL